MKIAVVTDNGETISNHFGRASHYMVVTVEEGKITDQEMRVKSGCGGGHGHGHGHGSHGHHHDHEHGHDHHHDHGHGGDSHHKQLAGITDCEVVMARGMGQGMYQNLQQVGIRAVMTDIAPIQDAITAFIEGRLDEHPELVH